MHTMRPDTCPDAAVVEIALAVLSWCARLQGRASSGKGPAEAAAVDQVITSPGGHTACSTNGVIPTRIHLSPLHDTHLPPPLIKTQSENFSVGQTGPL